MWWHWTDHMILIYKIMTNLVLLKSGQKKVTIEEVDSLLFCIFVCLKTYRKVFSCLILFLWEKIIWSFWLPAPTFSINSQMIALLKYSIAVHSIPCKADAKFIFYKCVNTWRPDGYIAKRATGEGQESQTPADLDAHKDGRVGGDSSRNRKQSALHKIRVSWQAQVDEIVP